MDLFHVIEDGAAILRLKGGLLKQTKVYRRGEKVYVPHSGGFLLLRKGQGTINLDILCLDVMGLGVTRVNDVPTWVEPKKPAKLAAVRG